HTREITGVRPRRLLRRRPRQSIRDRRRQRTRQQRQRGTGSHGNVDGPSHAANGRPLPATTSRDVPGGQWRAPLPRLLAARTEPKGASGSMCISEPRPVPLPRPALVDTAVWTWVRDRRFPALAEWFNTEVRAGRVLVCDLVRLELVRLMPNQERANELARRLAAFDAVPCPSRCGAGRGRCNSQWPYRVTIVASQRPTYSLPPRPNFHE
ncbi:MAG: hypothetical protein QOJ25_940, partial [Solirubrobacteraceae bacterium]|nr:hypothetical protein [Solirubrobacteraceae bacterium]